MPRRRPTLFGTALLAAACAAASAVPMNELFMRQSSCAPKFDQCKNADFPDYFCCPSGHRCIALAANTTVLCCPPGSECQRIQPVPCDISLQDGEKNPDSVVKTTALGGTLGRCGDDTCCPFGYSCSRTNECVMDKDQDTPPIQKTTARPGPTSTSGPVSSATGDPTNPDENRSTTSNFPEDGADTSSGPPIAAIAGGVTAAVVVLLGAALLAFILLKRKKKASRSGSPPKLSRSTSSFGNLISNPIVEQDTTLRSDFARVQGPRDTSPEPDSVTAAVIGSSVNSPDSGTLGAGPSGGVAKPAQQNSTSYAGYGQIKPAQFEPSRFVDMPDMPDVDADDDGGGGGGGGAGLAPQTPRQHREPSSVSINVFADPNITPDRTPETNNADRRYTNMTTFSQMLDNADLGGVARGESYVPYQAGGGRGAPSPRR